MKNPKVVYTASSNLLAHQIADMLEAHGVPAHAVEDQSGVSLWAFGTISQFHKPNVWVDKSMYDQALELVEAFENQRRERENTQESTGEIEVVCEECGKTTVFPNSLDGTTQECSHCYAYVDVGDLPWEDDYGEFEE